MGITYAVCALLLLISFLVSSRKNTPPLVFAWNPFKLIWLARLYKRDTMAALEVARKQCGDTFRLHLLTRIIYFSFNPESTKKFIGQWGKKLDFYQPTSANINTLINVEKAVKPYKTVCSRILYDSNRFLQPSISYLEDVIRKGLAVATLSTKQECVCKALDHILFCSLLRVIVGDHLDNAKEFRKYMTVVMVGLNNPWIHMMPEWWPWNGVKEFHEAKNFLLNNISTSLQQHPKKEGEEEDGTYASRLAMSIDGLGHDAMHVFAMLYGANVNTIPTAVIAAVLLSLPQHSDILCNLQNFLKSAQPSDIYSKFNLLDQILEETLRLYPVRVLTRVTVDDITDVDGYTVPRGCWFLLSPYLIHRSAQVFEDPDKFKPSRWSEQLVRQMRSEGKYISFGFGEHQCLGMRLARTVFKTFLCELFSNYRLNLADNNDYNVVYYSKKRGFQHPILGQIESL